MSGRILSAEQIAALGYWEPFEGVRKSHEALRAELKRARADADAAMAITSKWLDKNVALRAERDALADELDKATGAGIDLAAQLVEAARLLRLLYDWCEHKQWFVPSGMEIRAFLERTGQQQQQRDQVDAEDRQHQRDPEPEVHRDE